MYYDGPRYFLIEILEIHFVFNILVMVGFSLLGYFIFKKKYKEEIVPVLLNQFLLSYSLSFPCIWLPPEGIWLECSLVAELIVTVSLYFIFISRKIRRRINIIILVSLVLLWIFALVEFCFKIDW